MQKLLTWLLKSGSFDKYGCSSAPPVLTVQILCPNCKRKRVCCGCICQCDLAMTWLYFSLCWPGHTHYSWWQPSAPGGCHLPTKISYHLSQCIVWHRHISVFFFSPSNTFYSGKVSADLFEICTGRIIALLNCALSHGLFSRSGLRTYVIPRTTLVPCWSGWRRITSRRLTMSLPGSLQMTFWSRLPGVWENC